MLYFNKRIENDIFENEIKLQEQNRAFDDFYGIHYLCPTYSSKIHFYFDRQNISIHPCFASRQPLKPSNDSRLYKFHYTLLH